MIFRQGGGGSDNLLNAIADKLQKVGSSEASHGVASDSNRKVVARIIRGSGGVTSDLHLTSSANAPLYRKFGFTLSEVLITLGIIGIIAALTIPNLITNYQKKQTTSHLKKAYSQLAQAIEFAKIDNGPFLEWSIRTTVPDDLDYDREGLKYIVPYFKGASLKYHDDSGYFLYKKTSYPVNFKGENSGGAPLGRYWIETADGMFISANTTSWSGIQLFFQIDINGSKKPNVFGKDIFHFLLNSQNGKLIAYNATTPRDVILKTDCCKTCSGRGLSCSSVIMQDGWVIKDDYPW